MFSRINANKGGDKMVNVNKLRGKIVENAVNVEYIAKVIGIDRSTMYRKINSNGENITIKEAAIMAKELKLTRDEINDIFFADLVAL